MTNTAVIDLVNNYWWALLAVGLMAAILFAIIEFFMIKDKTGVRE